MHSFTSIPFKADKHQGLSEVNGVAKFSAAGVVLEFESKLFGLISNGVEEARLPIGEILDVRFRKGVFKRGAKIEIRAKSLASLAGIPNDSGKIILKLKAEDFERGRDAAERLARDVQTYEAQLPPTHTPVSVLFDPSEEETRKLGE